MSSSLVTVAVYMSMAVGPYNYGCATCGSNGYDPYTANMAVGGQMQAGYMGGGYMGGGQMGGGYAGPGPGQLFPYDNPEPWLHGYFQDIPAYGGYRSFRPYNYKHLMPQANTSGGWGMPVTMPYSQQFWHRYQQRAAMQQRMTEFGASEYTAELARLKARQDFDVRKQTAGYPGLVNGGLVAPQTANAGLPPRTIDPARFQRVPSINQLQHQLQQLTIQQQALQNALLQAYQQQGAVGPGR